ncbi:lambda exonuclease family protein [Vreelandella venusta]|uniref:lambda exonuclease family protein n=1 Tax=Vreelandella venusta TaxID=44935 RepID=UPI004044DD23
MQIIRELEQGTPEWHAARMGIVTMSELQCLLVNGKGPGGFGTGAITYMNQLIGERITEEPADAFQGNRHTERGHLLEPMARELYTERTGSELEQVGIILNHGAGYSPDSLVGNDGLAEIKTKLPKFQVEVLLDGEIPKEHIAQCQGGLWISEREWIDFISYYPGMPLFVKRAYRDEVMIRKISQRVKDFYELLDERMQQVMAA